MVNATPQIKTRRRPALITTAPVDEVVATHAATCPECERETFIRAGDQCTVTGSCRHFAGVQQSDGVIEVLFEIQPDAERGLHYARCA
jgi:hypothetical protein